MAVNIRRGVVVLALAAALGVSASGQQAQPTFKTDINAIMVDFRVVDRNGAFVDNLTPDDVQVFEDGKPQDISSFNLVRIPLEPVAPPTFAGRAVAPDTQSNEVDSERVYMLLLDDTGNPFRAPTVRAIARKFVTEYMRPDDRVALAASSGRKDLTVEFTSDKTRLLAAIDKYQGDFGAGVGPLFELRALARWLTFQGRRKSIVFISDHLTANLSLGPSPDETANLMDEVELAKAGRGHTIFEEFSRVDGMSAIDLRDVIDAAQHNNVSIYAIDPTGAPEKKAGDIKPVTFLSTPGSTVAERPLTRELRGQDALAVLAVETGGAALLRSNNFDGAFARVVDDASSYYLLGYASSNPAKDGKFRRIEVRARPGYYVRARSGYLAPSGKTPKPEKVPSGWTNELVSTIQSPIQIPGLTMDVGATVFRGAGKNGSVEVIVETRPNGFGLVESGNRSQGTVGLALVVADADGHSKASHQGDLDMQLTPEEREKVDEHGVRFLTRLKLKPGKYNMRVGSVDGVSSHDGSVHFPLDVPDFSKGSITMSGLAIESAAEGDRRPTTGQDKDWNRRFELPPTAARRFSNRDALTVLGEVYNNEKKTDPIMVTTTVRDESDAVVFTKQDTLTGADIYSRRVPIALADFAAGKYLLTMEARNLSKTKAITSKQVLFSVVP